MRDPKQYYILHIQEHLPQFWSEAFEGLEVNYDANGETLLSGAIADQSALHGLLARIRDLNLTLISVDRVACVDLIEARFDNPSSALEEEQ